MLKLPTSAFVLVKKLPVPLGAALACLALAGPAVAADAAREPGQAARQAAAVAGLLGLPEQVAESRRIGRPHVGLPSQQHRRSGRFEGHSGGFQTTEPGVHSEAQQGEEDDKRGKETHGGVMTEWVADVTRWLLKPAFLFLVARFLFFVRA